MLLSLLLMYKKYYKRIIDIIISLFGIFLISPFLFSFSIILFIINRGSPFYLHQRPGKNRKIFKMIKFKTMSDTCDINGNLLPDLQRITSLGRFLRHFSIDELPQLINVLKGDMSLIGPRPLLIQYLSIYNYQQARRHEVRPGMTGWSQINGRNTLSWEDRFELDVWYVDNISFLLDFKIISMTFIKVLKPHGINSSDEVVMRPFKGNE